MEPKKKLNWVQALRGLAALSVVVCHARNITLSNNYGASLAAALKPLAMGVDLFFLISGFIMVYTTKRCEASLSGAIDFLIKRFARIWPLYAVMTLAFMGYAYQWHVQDIPWAKIAKSLAFLPVDASRPPYFDQAYGVGWTLNFEMYFYTILAASLLAGRFRWHIFFGWIVFTLIVLPLFLTGQISMRPDHYYGLRGSYLNQMINPIIWDFVAGVLVGLLYQSHHTIRSWHFSRIAIAAFGAAIPLLCISGLTDFYGLFNWGLPLAITFAAMACSFKAHEPYVPRFMVWLGEISFSLYLVHFIVFSELELWLSRAARGEWTSSPLFAAASIMISVMAAHVSHQVLENRLSGYARTMLFSAMRRNDSQRSSLAEIETGQEA